MFREIAVEISNSYIQTVMTRFKLHSPLLSQYSGHLVDIFTHFFLSSSFNRGSPKQKTSPSTLLYKVFSKSVSKFNSDWKKIRSDKSSFTKIMYISCSRRKKRKKKRNFVIVSLWSIFLTIVLSVYLTKKQVSFCLVIFYWDKPAVFRLFML